MLRVLVSTGHLVAWVNVTSLSSTVDTILYMYYGNPTRSSEENIEETWDSNYLMVQHLSETSGTHYDSTSNNNDATAQNGLNQDANGKMDGADSYDDTDDFLLVSGGTANLLDNRGSWTYEAWLYPTKENCNIIGHLSESTFIFVNTDEAVGFATYYTGTGSSEFTSNGAITLNEWNHFVVTRDGSSITVYVDTASYSVTTSSSQNGNVGGNLQIGRNMADTTFVFGGIYDEVRFSDVARSSDWISTEFNNQNNPGAFCDVGSEEEYVGEKEYNISLQDGWNIVSAPCYDSIAKTDIIVRNNSIDRTWVQAVDNGTILGFLYDYNRTDQSYDFSDSLEPGYGYWVWAYYDCELRFSSSETGTGHITDLQDGWDIMGVPYNTTILKTSVNVTNNSVDYTWGQAVSNDIILGFIYGWNTTDQMYEICDDFDPGRGYWMYAYYNCSLTKVD